MFTSDVILAGTVVIEGTPFRWSVADGIAQQLTVYHPTLGARTQRLTKSSDAQARAIGRRMLVSKTIDLLEAVDDYPMPNGDPVPPIV